MSVKTMYKIISRYTSESHIQVARTPASYPACPWFESLSRGSLSLRIRRFLGIYHKTHTRHFQVRLNSMVRTLRLHIIHCYIF
jgi:hypothetical protein